MISVINVDHTLRVNCHKVVPTENNILYWHFFFYHVHWKLSYSIRPTRKQKGKNSSAFVFSEFNVNQRIFSTFSWVEYQNGSGQKSIYRRWTPRLRRLDIFHQKGNSTVSIDKKMKTSAISDRIPSANCNLYLHSICVDLCRAHKKFKQLSPEKVGHNKNAKLSMSKVLQYPELRVNPFGDRICKVFSSSNDGDLTFEDFLDMMSVFSDAAPRAVKAELAFRIFGEWAVEFGLFSYHFPVQNILRSN